MGGLFTTTTKATTNINQYFKNNVYNESNLNVLNKTMNTSISNYATEVAQSCAQAAGVTQEFAAKNITVKKGDTNPKLTI